jgi:hypothetical protein
MNKSLLAVSLAALMASGCASVSAKSKLEERPALLIPPPPPRILDPTPAPDDPPEPVPDLPSPPSGATSRPPRREAPKPANDPKTDPKPVEPVPLPAEPPPAAAPAAQLRTPQTADTSGAARTLRTTIDTARQILNGVNFPLLSNERKQAYNDAKLLLTQAEDGLKRGDLSFAQGLANKAETLARELAGR